MAQSTTQSIFRRYRAIFISVLVFLACDIGILVPTVYSSSKIAELAVSINLSGRQRMLSQRTTKVLLSLQDSARQGVPDTDGQKELHLVVGLFDTTLKGFRDGGTVTGGDGKPTYLARVETQEGRQFLQSAYEIWDPYLAKLQPLLKSSDFSPEQLNEAASYAKANNLKILGLMNDLTSDLEYTANQQTQLLWWIQIVGLVVVLVNVLYTVFKSLTNLMKGDRALAKAHKETGEILGTVKEGLFLINREFRLGSQYSKSAGQILQIDIAPAMPFFPILKKMVSKEVYDTAKDYIELLLGNRVKEALITTLNPLNQVEVRDTDGGEKPRYLRFNFNRALDDSGNISHLLVTVQDVTQLVQMAAQLEAAKGQAQIEVGMLLKLLNNDPDMLRQFLDNASKGLSEINEQLRSEADSGPDRLRLVNQIMRVVHGIKGEAAALNIEMFENYAHAFEKELVGMRDHGDVRGEDMVRITVLLDGFYDQLASITNIAEKVASSFYSNEGADDKFLRTFTSSLQNLVTRIAGDEHKEIKLICQLDELVRLPRRVTSELHDIAIQLLRNAVKHGIEMPDERASEGKSASGQIQVECKAMGDREYEFSIRDDGRGIAESKIREELVRKKMISAADANMLDSRQIMKHLFAPGFSTAKKVDRDAGHGVGLDVVAKKIIALRGRLKLNSEVRAFTEFKIRFSI